MADDSCQRDHAAGKLRLEARPQGTGFFMSVNISTKR
jgi:hypothetical protein